MKSKFKRCFVSDYCAFNCPNDRIEEFENYYDIPASDAGLERVSCRECGRFRGVCEDCMLYGTLDCFEKYLPELEYQENFQQLSFF